ncbi:hypothetical protein CHLRE_03g167690v5 [Chlamydomonas reinhardtii]|uniref:Uncharacterized protein n=1 Tax=Chlamydomonas reinhardtii TaxID=3055 RepID=A0A2K3DWU9_CHLRE|nr:uncharacterized protein CHLRE_03g167690v5 [Chlamydomonas reinhardtii]PNW85006.1 hypothetical protein CHLRE_03g167690v5 [Chlamydomonas reinhardtii]
MSGLEIPGPEVQKIAGVVLPSAPVKFQLEALQLLCVKHHGFRGHSSSVQPVYVMLVTPALVKPPPTT